MQFCCVVALFSVSLLAATVSIEVEEHRKLFKEVVTFVHRKHG